VLDAEGNVTGYRYESRPDTRTRQSLYWVNKVALGTEVLDLSYRRGKDSWAVDSDTLEGHVWIGLAPGWYLEPHVRWYRQSAADFYTLYLPGASPPPSYMSSDFRLAAFTATTFGVKLGFKVGRSGELAVRVEEYEQRPSEQSSSLPQLQGLNLNPNLEATIIQLSWHFGF
jgi:hypothetical protein